MTLAYIFAALTAPLVAVALLGEKRTAPWRGWAKGAASSLFLATAVAAGAADTTYGAWVLAALCLGWVGDVALVSDARSWFLLGLGSFLLSHVAYVVAFSTVRPGVLAAVVAGAALAGPGVLVLRWLWPHLDARMRIPVVAYVAVIGAMVAAAVGAAAGHGPIRPAMAPLSADQLAPHWFWQTAVLAAAAAFFTSDLLVARHRFVTRSFGNRLVGLPLYYLAQVLFALSTGWL